MQILNLTNDWIKLPYETGTIQTVDQSDNVLITDDNTKSEGFIIMPYKTFSYVNKVLYVRAKRNSANLTILPFELGPNSAENGPDITSLKKEIMIIKKYLSERDNTIFIGE